MTAKEFKVATVLAKDTKIPLPWDLIDCLFGCGCSDFSPVSVSLKSVAALLRYQCLCFDGSWDEAEYQNCKAIFVCRNSKVTVSDYMTDSEMREIVRAWIAPLVGKLEALPEES